MNLGDLKVNAASIPLSDPVHRADARMARLPLDQPLPASRATHLAIVDREQRGRVPASGDEGRLCAHWPKDGAAKIQTGARAVRTFAGIWAGTGSSASPPAALASCVDLEQPARAYPGHAPLPHLPSLAARIQAQKLALRALADDFATVSAWLARAAGSGWEAAKAVRQSLGLALALGEGQRLITKDWLAADMNALIAAMLRRSLNLLDRLELTSSAIEADLAGPRTYGRLLRRAAELLDRAATLACDAALLVGEFDQRWRAIRQQVAQAVAPGAGLAADREHQP